MPPGLPLYPPLARVDVHLWKTASASNSMQCSAIEKELRKIVNSLQKFSLFSLVPSMSKKQDVVLETVKGIFCCRFLKRKLEAII